MVSYKGNLKTVLTDALLFVVCDTSSCIILEFPWDASIILESMDSEENYERKNKRKKRSSILTWKIPWTEKPGGLVHEVAKSQT